MSIKPDEKRNCTPKNQIWSPPPLVRLMRVYIGLIGLDGLQIISLALHDVDVDDK